MTTRASSTSTEFYRVTVTPSPDVDLTTLPVRMAFPASEQPPTVWYAAQWEDDNTARVLLGPDGDVSLTAGAYDVYVEIEDTEETPRFIADRLIVFTTVSSFASVAELSDTMRTDIDPENPQANQALMAATALIRAYTRQEVTEVVDDVATLEAAWRDSLVLPELPVQDVSEVVAIDADGVETTVDPADYYLDNYGILRFRPTVPASWPWPWWWGRARVQVTYTHGYSTVPDQIRVACLQIASRLYQSSVNVGGGVPTKRAETIGGYSYENDYDPGSVAVTTTSGGLTSTEMVLLNRYKVVAAA